MPWIALLAPLFFVAQAAGEPSPTTGNNGSAPAEESIETAPGLAWYAFALVGSVIFGGLLVVLLLRQDRLDRKPPP